MPNHPNRSNLGDWYSPTAEEWRSKRIGAGLTQTQIGDMVCTPLRTVQDWEAGKRRIPAMAWELLLLKLA